MEVKKQKKQANSENLCPPPIKNFQTRALEKLKNAPQRCTIVGELC